MYRIDREVLIYRLHVYVALDIANNNSLVIGSAYHHPIAVLDMDALLLSCPLHILGYEVFHVFIY